MLTTDKIIEIFVKVDDFCKEFEVEITKHQLAAGNGKSRNRKASSFIVATTQILNTFT